MAKSIDAYLVLRSNMVILHKQKLGQEAEKKARAFLEAKGLYFLDANYRCRFGEIDIVMQDKDDIVFVEVRSRSRRDYGTAAQSINKTKMKKLILTATHYLQRKKWLYRVHSRFDVVAIHYQVKDASLEWIRNAFTADMR